MSVSVYNGQWHHSPRIRVTCFHTSSEYQSLDRQLDQLADYLTVMEGRSDRLTQDAQQLLEEAREARLNSTHQDPRTQS